MLKEYIFSSPRGRKAILGSGINFFKLINLFLAELCLHSAHGLSLVAVSGGYFLVATLWLPIEVASLVVENRF